MNAAAQGTHTAGVFVKLNSVVQQPNAHNDTSVTMTDLALHKITADWLETLWDVLLYWIFLLAYHSQYKWFSISLSAPSQKEGRYMWESDSALEALD